MLDSGIGISAAKLKMQFPPTCRLRLTQNWLPKRLRYPDSRKHLDTVMALKHVSAECLCSMG